ncbi:MAG: ABC transporter substrate-binding protein [Pseudomonadota bacterium]|nr:ABC transporter substrate-binding protein [Pseudomonadota bacterium]
MPQQLRVLYEGEVNMGASAYDTLPMPAKPWKWCHSESYQGNPWRVALTNELRRLVDLYKSKGWVSGFELSDSNGDTSRQISQVRAFIDKKCSIITAVPGSATGLNDAIAASYKADIPFVTISASVTSPYAINVDSNYTRWGYDMMHAIGETLGGKGKIIMVEGIPGAPIVAQERTGAEKALKEFPDLKVLRRVNGNWTANVTKTVVLEALATTPQKVDAVWTTGSESRVIAEAFAEAGRPAPLITGSISGDALGYWKEHPDRYHFEGNGVLPAWNSQALFRVTVRLLEGQQPKLNTLLIPIPVVHGTDLGKWYRPCMTPNSVSVFPVAPEDPMPAQLMDAYFRKPAPIAFYDYAQMPDPCSAK